MKELKERIEGLGELETWERPGHRFLVGYGFDITTEALERPGFPRVSTRRNSNGVVGALSGEFIAEGYYRLFASGGEILKVQKVAHGQWVILAS
jgi:hypothetical protein